MAYPQITTKSERVEILQREWKEQKKEYIINLIFFNSWCMDNFLYYCFISYKIYDFCRVPDSF
jgi:hypothetical protein